MKICAKCGAHNSDARTFCIDCNETLGDPLSPSEEAQMRLDTNGKVEDLHNKIDPLYVSVFDKVLGILSAIGAACSLVLIIVCGISPGGFDSVWFQSSGLAFLCLLFAGLDALVPQILWTLEKIALSRRYDNVDDIEPGRYYGIRRKASILLLMVIGLALLAFNLFDLQNLWLGTY